MRSRSPGTPRTRGAPRALGIAAAVAITLGGVATLEAPATSSALSFEGQETRLARELSEGVSTQRVLAASELATLAPAAARPLVELALRDTEIDVRRHAAAAAGELGLVEALAITRPWLESDDEELRAVAVSLEGVLGDAASVPLLSRALGDARFVVRSAAARALGRLGLEACAVPLGTALEDSDATVRVVAADALGHTPGSEALRLLLARSLDPTLEVRVEVIQALSSRHELEGEAEMLDGRIAAVLIGALADDASEVRVAAILGLSRARHAGAAPHLVRVLDEAQLATSTRPPEETREIHAVISALGRIDEPAARAALVRALARGLETTAVVAALRAQCQRAPGAVEDELARAIASEALVEAPEARARVIASILELGPLPGGEVSTRAVLEALSDPRVPAGPVLRSLGAVLPVRERRGPEGSSREGSGAIALGGVSEDAMVALLAHVAIPTTADAAIEGLERAADRGVLDPRAVDALLAAGANGPTSVATTSAAATSAATTSAATTSAATTSAARGRTERVLALLGRFEDPRAVPTWMTYATGEPGPLRRASLLSLARLQTLPEGARRALLASLVRELGALDEDERLAMREIALRQGDEASIETLVSALEGVGVLDRSLAIELLVALVARPDLELDEGLRARAEATILEALASTDPRRSSAAASAILASDAPGPRAVGSRAVGSRALGLRALVAQAVERSRRSGRGDAVALARVARATGCVTEACRALRDASDEHDLDVIERGGGEGARSDAGAALREPELRFPRSIVRSYALLVAVRRGEVGAEAVPTLCAMAARREPAVRANAGLALASLGARCEGVDPTTWIARGRSVAVQLAGARWCAVGGAEPPCAPRPLARATERCLDTASDPALRSACAAIAGRDVPPTTEVATPIDLTVVDDEGRPEAGRLVMLRFVDGSSVALWTDAAGRVALHLDHAVRADRESPIVVEDPFAMVLER